MEVFKTLEKFKAGIILELLKKSYDKLIQYYPGEMERFYSQWENEDQETFNNPDTVGKHVLFTCINDLPIGFVSWDDREYPKGIIGQNCIIPDYQGQGHGTKQVQKVINIFETNRFKEISVITGNHEFFKPARKMYLSLGFKERNELDGDLFKRVEFIKVCVRY